MMKGVNVYLNPNLDNRDLSYAAAAAKDTRRTKRESDQYHRDLARARKARNRMDEWAEYVATAKESHS